jgi:hypothetical protein
MPASLSSRPSPFLRQGVNPIQDGSDQILMRPSASGRGRPWRLPEPGEIRLAGLEQFLRKAAHLFKTGNRQAQPPIQEVASHPLDEAAQNLLYGRRLSRPSRVQEQGSPAVEIPGELDEHRSGGRKGHGGRRGIHASDPHAYSATAANVTVPCGSGHWL